MSFGADLTPLLLEAFGTGFVGGAAFAAAGLVAWLHLAGRDQ